MKSFMSNSNSPHIMDMKLNAIAHLEVAGACSR